MNLEKRTEIDKKNHFGKKTVNFIKQYPDQIKEYFPESMYSGLIFAGISVPLEMFFIPSLTVWGSVWRRGLIFGASAALFPALIKPASKSPKNKKDLTKRIIGSFVGAMSLNMTYYMVATDASLIESFYASVGISAATAFITDYLPEFKNNVKKKYVSASLAVITTLATYATYLDRSDQIDKSVDTDFNITYPNHLKSFTFDSIPDHSYFQKVDACSDGTNVVTPISKFLYLK